MIEARREGDGFVGTHVRLPGDFAKSLGLELEMDEMQKH